MNSEQGFTLIEILIYSAILAVFVGGVLALVGSILSSTDKLASRNEVLMNKELIASRLNWILGQTTKVIQPSANSSSSKLEVEYGKNLDSATFSLHNDKLKLLLQGNSTSTALTNTRVKVEDFLAEHFRTNQASTTLRISFEVESDRFENINTTSTLFFKLPE